MKRMNLLPPELRPREGGRRGSSYLVIGALFASVVAMLVYAMVIGGVRSDETELASLKERDRSKRNARADALRPYGEFAEMKHQRERSIRTVADTRFDYERLTRELARILARRRVGRPPRRRARAAGAGCRSRQARTPWIGAQATAARDDRLGLRARPGSRRRHARPPARAHRRHERRARLVEQLWHAATVFERPGASPRERLRRERPMRRLPAARASRSTRPSR